MERKKIKATCQNGVIEPLDRVDPPEGQELEVEFSILQKTRCELTPEAATQTYTALIRQSEGWWIGWILEVHGVIGQERTRSELLDTLQITLREILEYETPEVSHRTESEAAEIKVSDILEFGDHGASHQTKSGFEEVKIDVSTIQI